MADPFVYAFEWDPAKATDNIAKHGVAFEIAASVLRDPLALTVYDPEHSGTDERWISIGRAENGKLLVVVHTFQETSASSAAVRIISAREATKRERGNYQETPR